MSDAGDLELTCWTCGKPVLRPGSLPEPQRELARLISLVALGFFIAVIALVVTFYHPA